MSVLFKQAVAVIDSRTTNICLKVAGQIQPLDDPFSTLNGDFDEPPFHVHCRTMISAYMEGFVNEQRDLSNAELQKRPLKQRDTRGARTAPPDRTNLPRSSTTAKANPVRPFGEWTDKEFTTQHKEWFGQLSRSEQSTWRDYAAGGSHMNADLRRGNLSEIPDWRRESIADFDGLFKSQGLTMPQDTVVKRGVYSLPGFDPEEVFTDLFKAGREFVEPGWTSTTTSQTMINSQFRNQWTYRITVPKGAKYVYGVDGQFEVILPRNSRYKIISMDAETKEITMELLT